MIATRHLWKLLTLCVVIFLSCTAFSRDQKAHEQIQDPRQWENEWVRGAVFYQIFVRSFADSNGDGIGDFNGLISKLDYLNDGDSNTNEDLGIKGIWLMPVFKSPSYHGYDVTDYLHINPDYGTDQDFEQFLKQTHDRGIRVIIDFVMNHTSSEHPWFIESGSSASSPKRDWYIWSATNPGWTPPWGGSNATWHPKNGAYYYGVFWSGMPDLNYRNGDVSKEMKRIAGYWIRKGVNGFRLDAARHLIEDGAGPLQSDTPETHAFWKSFSAHIRNVDPKTILVGENWTDTPIIATYFGSNQTISGGDELPLNFNFPLAESILNGLKSGDASGIAAKLAEVKALYPTNAKDATFLTNHDQVRLATQLQNNPQWLRNAAAILLTLPGTPFIYYGEEIGVQNGPASGDEAKRTPMPWNNSPGGGFTTGTPWFAFSPGKDHANVAAQISNSASLLSHYRNLIQLRNNSTVLSKGSLNVVTPGTGATPVLAYLRENETEQNLVVHNLSNSFAVAGPLNIQAAALDRLFASGAPGEPVRSGSHWQVPLPPHSMGVWRLRK